MRLVQSTKPARVSQGSRALASSNSESGDSGLEYSTSDEANDTESDYGDDSDDDSDDETEDWSEEGIEDSSDEEDEEDVSQSNSSNVDDPKSLIPSIVTGGRTRTGSTSSQVSAISSPKSSTSAREREEGMKELDALETELFDASTPSPPSNQATQSNTRSSKPASSHKTKQHKAQHAKRTSHKYKDSASQLRKNEDERPRLKHRSHLIPPASDDEDGDGLITHRSK